MRSNQLWIQQFLLVSSRGQGGSGHEPLQMLHQLHLRWSLVQLQPTSFLPLFLNRSSSSPCCRASTPPWLVPFDVEPSPALSSTTSDDTRGIPISGCLGRGSTSFYKGGDISDIGNDDVIDAGADDDYVADIIVAHEAWDLGPTQD